MVENFVEGMQRFISQNIIGYWNTLYQYPIKLVELVVDVALVILLVVYVIKIFRDTRAMQLLKGILFLVIITALSEVLKLNILNYILTSFMTYIVIILVVVFQPELRRVLEQLGRSRITNFFGFDRDIEAKTKQVIYKITIATKELSELKTGALIVFERDIKIGEVIDTGIPIDAEFSPQLLGNIFVSGTPLHDGAVIIKNNKIAAASCILPLIDDRELNKKYGTRHRSAMGITKETDAIAIVVSEETGRISVSKGGRLTTDVNEEQLKKFLTANLIIKQNK